MSRSTLTRNDTPVPDVALISGGISRLRAAALVPGSTETSLKALESVLRSAMTLRPLVSVPAMDGNLLSRSVVAPACTTRSAICEDCWARVSVAGTAAASTSTITWLFSSSRRDSPVSAVSESEICAVRRSMVLRS